MKVASIDVRDEDVIDNLVKCYNKIRSTETIWNDYELSAYIPKTTNSRLYNIIYSPYVGNPNKIRNNYYSGSPYGVDSYKSCEGISVEVSKNGILHCSTIIEGEPYSCQTLMTWELWKRELI
jgi:hypothetical protein